MKGQLQFGATIKNVSLHKLKGLKSSMLTLTLFGMPTILSGPVELLNTTPALEIIDCGGT